MNRVIQSSVSLLAVCANLAVCAGGDADQKQPAPAIVVLDESLGCFHHDVSRIEYVLEGDHYVGAGKRFPKNYIDGLRSILLSSHADTSGLLEQVGFTPEKLGERQGAIYRSVRRNCPELPLDPPDWVKPFLEYDKVRNIAFKEIAGPPTCSTTTVVFKVTIPGDPPMTVFSEQERPWMLPWTIEADGRTWQTYSLQVSKALTVLSDPRGPNATLLDGTHYWARDIWHDVSVWEFSLGRQINEIFSRSMCESIQGYDRARRYYLIESAQIGDINSAPRSLFINVIASTPELIDGARWWNPIEDDRPARDWNDFVALHKSCTDAAMPHSWLASWKEAGPQRTISLDAVGTTGFSESNMEFAVYPTWTGLGLAGRPQFELLLRESDRWCATIFLGSQEKRALIMNLHERTGEHWLDKMSVQAPYCMVVDRQGQFEKHRLITKPRR